MFGSVLRPIARNVLKRGSRSYHEPAVPYKPPTMDELPIPQGSWQEYYNSKQRIYNIHLAAGLIYCIGTLSYIIGTEALFFNFYPPVPKDEKK